MQRLTRGRSGTLKADFSPSAPASATVTVTNDAGTVVMATTAATMIGSIATKAITPQTQLDRLTCVWVGGGETITTYVDVVGARLLLPAALAVDGKTDAEKEEAILLAEQTLEDACHVSFYPAYRKERLGNIKLSRAKVRSIRSCTVNGASVIDSSMVRVVGERHIQRRQFSASAVLSWIGNLSEAAYANEDHREIVVAYEHGYDTPPAGASRAAKLLAEDFLTTAPSDWFDRASSISTEDGATYSLATPGIREAVSTIPEVNAFVQRYDEGE